MAPSFFGLSKSNGRFELRKKFHYSKMELFGSLEYCMKVLICSILTWKNVNELRLFRNAHNIFGEKK